MILALLALAVQAPPSPQRVLIQDVTVVSPERTDAAAARLCRPGGRADRGGGAGNAAGRHIGIPSSSGGGRVLIPGLIDGHTHLAVPAGCWSRSRTTSRRSRPRYAEQLPRSYLYSGFTTVVDLAVFDRAFLDRLEAAPAPPRHLRLWRRAPAGERVSDGDGPERSELGALPQLPLRPAAEGRHPYPVPAGGSHSACGRRPGGGGQRDLREDFRGARLRSGEEPAYADAGDDPGRGAGEPCPWPARADPRQLAGRLAVRDRGRSRRDRPWDVELGRVRAGRRGAARAHPRRRSTRSRPAGSASCRRSG